MWSERFAPLIAEQTAERLSDRLRDIEEELEELARDSANRSRSNRSRSIQRVEVRQYRSELDKREDLPTATVNNIFK